MIHQRFSQILVVAFKVIFLPLVHYVMPHLGSTDHMHLFDRFLVQLRSHDRLLSELFLLEDLEFFPQSLDFCLPLLLIIDDHLWGKAFLSKQVHLILRAISTSLLINLLNIVPKLVSSDHSIGFLEAGELEKFLFRELTSIRVSWLSLLFILILLFFSLAFILILFIELLLLFQLLVVLVL
mmetsp:Transcript_16182/g.15566  ORF Transcript_16182/g.15566 Transcript_16182/m.15566 type:complete len:181 (-) Transcript_16182:897-1439(-)